MGGLFFFPREKVPSAFLVPLGTKKWLFLAIREKSSLGPKSLKTLISRLIFKFSIIPTVPRGMIVHRKEKIPSEKMQTVQSAANQSCAI